MTITIEIDGKKIEVEKNTTIIAAADKAGIPIPRFCYHKKLSIAARYSNISKKTWPVYKVL